VLEPEDVPEIVYRLFEDALENQIRIATFAVKFTAQAVRGDDRDAVFFARVAKDKLMRRFVEIEIRDGEPNTIDGRNDRGYAGNERIEEHLFANAVERRGRNAQDTLHDTREKEPFLKA